MKEIAWTDDLAVGIELIDAQHKELIQHLRDLDDALKSGVGPAKVSSTLNFLIDYTKFHFTEEEKHMASNAYPEIENHKEKHAEFKKTLADLEDELEEEGATKMMADSIDTLLVNWLFKHISTVDVAFGKFLKEKGIEIPE